MITATIEMLGILALTAAFVWFGTNGLMRLVEIIVDAIVGSRCIGNGH